MDYKTLDDEALLILIAHRQENALCELYDRYSRLVYSMAINSIGEPYLAEEVTQDVFFRIWEKANTYRPDQGKVITWMASIARYRAIDLARRQKVRPEGYIATWADEEDFHLVENGSVEEQLEMLQQRKRVRQAIAQLPKEQRQALAYAYFHGYSHREIAEFTKEPLGTIKTRIRSAMIKLRQALQEENLPTI